MNIEEAIKKIKGKNIFSSEKTETGYDYMENINEVINILLIYVDTMHKEFDRLEGIEDNTSMLKQELIETKEHNRQLALELKKKNKVIDEMAEYITNLDVDEDICKNIEHCASDKKLCRDCIKEYFYKKVE